MELRTATWSIQNLLCVRVHVYTHEARELIVRWKLHVEDRGLWFLVPISKEKRVWTKANAHWVRYAWIYGSWNLILQHAVHQKSRRRYYRLKWTIVNRMACWGFRSGCHTLYHDCRIPAFPKCSEIWLVVWQIDEKKVTSRLNIHYKSYFSLKTVDKKLLFCTKD